MGRTAKPKSQKALQNRKPNKSPLDDLIQPDPVSISELPERPEHFDGYALAEWHYITPELAKLGVLALIDYRAIAMYCEAYGRYRDAVEKLKEHGEVFFTEKGYQMPSPYVAICNKNYELCVKMLKEFGLTPQSRRKMAKTDDKTPGESEFERWQRKKRDIDKKTRKK